jgi:hypothetical protein
MAKGKGFPALPFHIGVDQQPWFKDSRSPGEGSFKKSSKKKASKKGK